MSVFDATFRQLDVLRDKGALDETNEALGELALNLAHTLDGGAGLAAAAVSRELRATLQEIAKTLQGEDDGWEDIASGLGVAGLSSLGYPKD